MFENELAETLSLSGTWQFEIGDEKGEIRVPGAWEAQGYSGKAGVNDPAIYRRAFDVPKAWENTEIWLRFGAVSYYTEVFINGVQVRTHEGMWTAFEFDVTRMLRFGETNELEVRVTKPGYPGDRFPYRDVLGGFLPYVSDNFGGIWQDVSLTSHRGEGFYAIRMTPNYETGQIEVYARVRDDVYADLRQDPISENVKECFWVTVTDRMGNVVAQAKQRAAMVNDITLTIEPLVRWSPASPMVYTLILQVTWNDEVVAQTIRQIGFRKLNAEGDKLRLNGEPIHLRGALSWGWDPKTLAPMPTDEEVRDEFRRVRELGFNLIKLCLFVPPENVFRIADEEGMLLWLELPLWLPNLSEHLREQARIEYRDIMQRVQHHPSVVVYSLGCELGSDMADAALLDALNSTVRANSRGALVCDNSGSGEAYAGLNFDYADFNDYHFYADLHYFTPLLDLFRRDWRPSRPLIFGEFCDSDDYRDPAALLEDGKRPKWRDYFGIEGNLSRWAYSIQEDLMATNALPFTDAQIAAISRKQSFVVRKTILERTRGRGEIGGYVLTGLRDTPMSSSGVFDDAGLNKYDPNEFRMFNSDAVLVLEQGRTRRWTNGGDRPYPTDLFNHRSGGQASFRVVLALTQAAKGGNYGELWWHIGSLKGGNYGGKVHLDKSVTESPCEIARIEFKLPEVERAEQWTFEVELDDGLKNHWPMWIYPTLPALDASVYDPAGTLSDLHALPKADFSSDKIVIAGAFTAELEAFVRGGGRTVLIQTGAGALATQAVPFWRESIKLLCDHPIMNEFPHQGYADLQFYHLATDQGFDTATFRDMDVVHVMRRLDARLFTMLDYITDVRVGKGRMIATTLRLFGGAGDQVHGLEGNVAGEYLLHLMRRALD